MTHICVSKLTIIGSDNGLSPGWHKAIIWKNAGILLIKPLGKKSVKTLSKFIQFRSPECNWKCRLRNRSHFISASMCFTAKLLIHYGSLRIEFNWIFFAELNLPLRWRHNELGDVSNHQPHNCLLIYDVYSGADQRKHQSSASLAFVRGIHRWAVNSLHKWPVTRKMFPYDVITSNDIGNLGWWVHCLPRWRTLITNTISVSRNDRNDKVHDDVIKWKHFPRNWAFVRGIHRSPVNSPQKGQWRGAMMFSLICAWIGSWVNNRETSDLRRHRAHYDVTVMVNSIQHVNG